MKHFASFIAFSTLLLAAPPAKADLLLSALERICVEPMLQGLEPDLSEFEEVIDAIGLGGNYDIGNGYAVSVFPASDFTMCHVSTQHSKSRLDSDLEAEIDAVESWIEAQVEAQSLVPNWKYRIIDTEADFNSRYRLVGPDIVDCYFYFWKIENAHWFPIPTLSFASSSMDAGYC